MHTIPLILTLTLTQKSRTNLVRLVVRNVDIRDAVAVWVLFAPEQDARLAASRSRQPRVSVRGKAIRPEVLVAATKKDCRRDRTINGTPITGAILKNELEQIMSSYYR